MENDTRNVAVYINFPEKRKIHSNAFDTLFSIILTIVVCDLFKHEKPHHFHLPNPSKPL